MIFGLCDTCEIGDMGVFGDVGEIRDFGEVADIGDLLDRTSSISSIGLI